MKEFYQKVGFTKSAAVFTLIFGLIMVHFGEKVALRGGKGWDGVTFVYYAQNFDSLISNRLINTEIRDGDLTLTHKVNRFFPSMIVNFAIRVSGQTLNTPNIIRTFDYYNTLCLIITVLFIGLIGDKFQFKEKNKWLLWVFLILNFAIAKRGYYEPALSDTTALMLSVGLIAFWAKNDWKGTVGLISVAIVGAFCWQPVTVYAYFLLLFPRNIKFIRQKNIWLNTTFPILFGGVFLYGFWQSFQTGGIDYFNSTVVPAFGQLPYYEKGLKISAGLAAVFTAGYFGFILKDSSLRNFLYFVRPKILRRILPVVVLYFSVDFFERIGRPRGFNRQRFDLRRHFRCIE